MNKVVVLAALAWNLWGLSFIAIAQPQSRVSVIGLLMVSASQKDSNIEGIRDGLRTLGHTEGQSFRFEYRTAEGHLDRLAGLAAELVRLKVDVIVCGTDAATRAAKQATTAIPIVAILPEHDPVALGFIESFSHPGGNITGLTVRNSQLGPKRLQLLKEIVPGLTRVAVLSDSFVRAEIEAIRPAGQALGLELQVVEVPEPFDFDAVLSSAKRQRAGALMLLSSPQVYVRRLQLGTLAVQRGVPVDSPFHDLTRTGGLMSYSTDVRDGFFRSAYFIDQVLKGTKPADLPFEQTANIRLIINARTANALHLTIPDSVLFRADEVIR